MRSRFSPLTCSGSRANSEHHNSQNPFVRHKTTSLFISPLKNNFNLNPCDECSLFSCRLKSKKGKEKKMEKKMFVSLFLERTVKALCNKVSSLEFRHSASDEEYVMINLTAEPPLIVPATGSTNIEMTIAVLNALQKIGG